MIDVLLASADHASNGSIWSEALEIVSDPAHMLAEGITEAISYTLAALFGAWWVKRHDRKHHDHICERDD